MKKILLSALLLAGLSFGTMTSAMAEGKIAIVDVQAVVAKSAQVQALKKEQKTKIQDLEKWIKVCQADIAKQTTKEGKEKLAKKYDAELKTRQETISKNYKDKLQAIDKSISDTIAAQAKANGYDIVITKNAVVYGGDDLTEAIIKVVK